MLISGLNMKRRTVALAVPAVAALFGAVHLTASSGDAADSGRDGSGAIAAVSSVILDHFKVFDSPSAQAMPAAVRESIASPRRYGRNADFARAIETSTGRGWVIPGDGTICVAMPDPADGYATACLPETMAVETGVYVGLIDGATLRTQITLVLPDRTTSVRVTEPSGKTSSLKGDPQGVVRASVAGGSILETSIGGVTRQHQVGATEAPSTLGR